MRALARVILLGSLTSWIGMASALADEQPSGRARLARLGKAATVLVEVGGSRSQVYGSAFCVHASGLFLTNDHVVHPRETFPLMQQEDVGPIRLVIDPGQNSEKVYPARIIRSDSDLDLALVRVEGEHHFATLSLGDDDGLQELADVVVFGFPFGAEVAGNGSPFSDQGSGRRDYPSVSVNAGSVTALRRKGGKLDRIQLDATINPGNSGGPVLDKDGKVIGVVRSMAVSQRLGKTGISYAIPVSLVSRFLARPDIEFDPPILTASNVHKPVLFEAKVVPLLPSPTPLGVDLILKLARGSEHVYHLEAVGTKYRVKAVPAPPSAGPWQLRLQAQFENGLLNATAEDRSFTIGGRSVRFSDVRSLQLKPSPRLTLDDGKVIEGAVSGLDGVRVQLGEQSLSVDLAKAVEVKLAPAVDTDQLWYTLLVKQGDREVFRQTDRLATEGLLPGPVASAGPSGFKRPTLEGNPSVRRLPAPLDDVVVGGAGRFLVCRLPSLHKLAVFDVGAGEVAGYIPIKEDDAPFAAGREHVVVLLPEAGKMERWNLQTRQREVETELPIKGGIHGVAMGSASTGPLLVHWVRQGNMMSAFALIDVERMKLAESELATVPLMSAMLISREIVHIRAAANGKVFGLWCTSHSPSGVGVIVASETHVQSYYGHWSAGYVVPGPDGKTLFTRLGQCPPEVTMMGMRGLNSDPELPACQGDYYLRLPPDPHSRRVPWPRPGAQQPSQRAAAKAAAVTVHALNGDRVIATIPGLDLLGPGDDWIKNDLTPDKRIYLFSEARLIITIPASNDHLVLRAFGG